ncbi:MAG: hypothetical protein HQ521_05930 [Bacteroidetes bacterium]|nr:hypothetical protein [Bacteroidota bacterium]
MKKIIIGLIFLSQFTFGQTNGRQFVGLSIGPSFPLSDFSKSKLIDSTSGFAKTGIAMSFNYAYRVSHNFGIQLIINYSSNSLNSSKYKNELESAHPNYGVSVESTKSWSSGGLFLGPYLRFPVFENFSWDIRALAGYFGSYSPNATIRTTNKNDLNDKGEYYLVSSRASNFGYILGTGFKYKVGSYYVLLFGDYIQSTLKFKDATGWDWDGEPYHTTFNQRINYFAITGGVGYIL